MCLIYNDYGLTKAAKARKEDKYHTFYKVLEVEITNSNSYEYYTPYVGRRIIPGRTYRPNTRRDLGKIKDLLKSLEGKVIKNEGIHLCTSKRATIGHRSYNGFCIPIKVRGRDIIAFGENKDVVVRKVTYPKNFEKYIPKRLKVKEYGW